MALLWAGGIIWTAVQFASDTNTDTRQPDEAHDTADNQVAAIGNLIARLPD